LSASLNGPLTTRLKVDFAPMRSAVPAPLIDLVRYPMRRVELRAILMRPYWKWRFHSFGDDAIVHRPGGILGPRQIAIGSHTLILQGCHLAVETPAWSLPAPVLRIGNRVGIRPHCLISAAESIVIEDDVIIGAFSSVIDSDHTFREGRPNVMHNSLATAPIRIGRGTWLAERVAVLRGSSIGRCCIVGANSVVRGELPDYSIAVGAPARVVGHVEGVDADARPFSERLY
jgi:acetyltransferase-like isoleucine patch superfamily enzyme